VTHRLVVVKDPNAINNPSTVFSASTWSPTLPSANQRLGAKASARRGPERAESRSGGHSAHGYEPQLLGYVGYDRTKQRIDRFEMVALGGFYGTFYGDNRILYRSGSTPLGVAFELVTADSPAADRLHR
jgi:hypothetical protein